MHFELDAEIFVAIAFVLFLCLLGYVGVHKLIGNALDARINRVKGELAEAERLRAEAASLLASFEGKRKAAEAEATAIVAQAKQEADMLAQEAQARIADFVARRTRQAQEKIALAEAQAANDVRAAAADAAVRAAALVMGHDLQGAAGAGLVEQGIADLKRLAH
jgi:F-type H+-transporting ATPase subunit b